MELEDEQLINAKSTTKLNTWKTTFLIMSQMMGSGVLSMPHVIYISKVFGIIGIVVIGVLNCYCGILIGRCMVMIENVMECSDRHIHSPFTFIGELCYGKLGRVAVPWCISVTAFGSGVVLLLLSAELANELDIHFNISYCNWILIFGILHIIPSFFPSPKDLWQIGVFSVATSIIPYSIVFGLMIYKYSNYEEEASKPFEPTAWSVITSLSSIMFFNNATQSYPTIQYDMKHKRDFMKAVSFAYFGLISFYMLFGIISYTLLEEDVNPDILLSLPSSKLLIFIRIIFMLHTIIANVIQLNPLFQEVEKVFNISIQFSFKMVLSRIVVLGLITLGGLSIPKFNYVLNIIGSATIPFLSFIFPSMFYLKLISRFGDEYRASFAVKCLIILIIVFGFLASSTATFVSMYQVLSSETSAKSCFLA